MVWDKILLAGLAGGVVLFVWNAIAWMAIKHHNSDFKRIPDSGAVSDALTKSGVSAGMYMVPHCDEFPLGVKDPAFAERYKKGPNATLIVAAPGPCMTGSTFGVGFLFCVLEALGAAILFRFAGGHFEALHRAVAFGAGLGLLVHGIPHAAQSNWASFPWSHAAKSAFDGLVGMALACLAFHFIL